jgi:hypothetical protein
VQYSKRWRKLLTQVACVNACLIISVVALWLVTGTGLLDALCLIKKIQSFSSSRSLTWADKYSCYDAKTNLLLMVTDRKGNLMCTAEGEDASYNPLQQSVKNASVLEHSSGPRTEAKLLMLGIL